VVRKQYEICTAAAAMVVNPEAALRDCEARVRALTREVGSLREDLRRECKRRERAVAVVRQNCVASQLACAGRAHQAQLAKLTSLSLGNGKGWGALVVGSTTVVADMNSMRAGRPAGRGMQSCPVKAKGGGVCESQAGS
jgi:hypothetical protein